MSETPTGLPGEIPSPPQGPPILTPAEEDRLATLLTILSGSTAIVNDPHRFYREGSDDLINGLHILQNYCYDQIAEMLTPNPEATPTSE